MGYSYDRDYFTLSCVCCGNEWSTTDALTDDWGGECPSCGSLGLPCEEAGDDVLDVEELNFEDQ